MALVKDITLAVLVFSVGILVGLALGTYDRKRRNARKEYRRKQSAWREARRAYGSIPEDMVLHHVDPRNNEAKNLMLIDPRENHCTGEE